MEGRFQGGHIEGQIYICDDIVDPEYLGIGKPKIWDHRDCFGEPSPHKTKGGWVYMEEVGEMTLDFYRKGGEILFDFGPSLKLVADQEKRIKGANLSWKAHWEATKMLFNGRWERGHEIMEDILEQAGEGMMKYRMMVEDEYLSMGKERTQMAITKLLSRLEGEGDDHSISSDSNQAEQLQVSSAIQDKIGTELSKWEEEWKGGALGKGLGEITSTKKSPQLVHRKEKDKTGIQATSGPKRKEIIVQFS